MTEIRFSRVDRRAFLSGAAVCALAGAGWPVLAPAPRRRRTIRPNGARATRPPHADLRRSRDDADAVARHGRGDRSGDPALSEHRRARRLEQVPGGAELKIGVKSKAVQALRQRLIASGDLDPVAGMGPTFNSFVEAAVKRFQVRHGLGADRRRQRRDARRAQRHRRGAAAAAARPISCGCARSPAISASASSWSTFPPPRSRRSRTASSIRITSPASARSTASRRSCRPRRPRSISIRSGRCRLR